MKSVYFCGALLLWCSALAVGQSSNPHKNPADFMPPIYRGEGMIDKNNGIHAVDQPEPQNPPQPRVRLDRAQIRREADELSRLAQAVSKEISETEKGMLPKDLSENLKKVQKLSKRLRGELRL
jgi:hypothetical protein